MSGLDMRLSSLSAAFLKVPSNFIPAKFAEYINF